MSEAFEWSKELDRILRDVWESDSTINEIAERIGCFPGQVYARAAYLHLDTSARGAEAFFRECAESNTVQNDKFCAAMKRAVAAGLESPPMIGIDTRPGTKAPRFIPIDRAKFTASSPAALVAEP